MKEIRQLRKSLNLGTLSCLGVSPRNVPFHGAAGHHNVLNVVVCIENQKTRDALAGWFIVEAHNTLEHFRDRYIGNRNPKELIWYEYRRRLDLTPDRAVNEYFSVGTRNGWRGIVGLVKELTSELTEPVAIDLVMPATERDYNPNEFKIRPEIYFMNEVDAIHFRSRWFE